MDADCRMALLLHSHSPLLFRCSTLCLREPALPPNSHRRRLHLSPTTTISNLRISPLLRSHRRQHARAHQSNSGDSSSDDDDNASNNDNDPYFMTKEEREEMRRKIREVLDRVEDPAEETDPVQRKIKMQKLLEEYPLVVEDEDPNWPEDADGRGFNLDQFFDKITIKNVKKDDDEDHDSDKEIVWQDDNYIKPIRDITAGEWEDTVFRDFNPLVILVHNRYKRPRENERARIELERAVKMFWETGLPSPRCVAVDAVIEEELVSALQVSVFPEILFTKAGKIMHRDKVVRSAEEWSKIMAFFYYKAVRPSCLSEAAGQSQEKIPSIS